VVSQWVVVVVVGMEAVTRNMLLAEVAWAAAAVDSGVVGAGTIHLVEATSVVIRQVEATSVVTLQVEATSVVTLQVEATSVVTLQVEEVDMLLLVEAATVVPVEAAGVVMAVAVPIVLPRVPAPAPVLHGEYRYTDKLSGHVVI
jgi:hypothetical protein